MARGLPGGTHLPKADLALHSRVTANLHVRLTFLGPELLSRGVSQALMYSVSIPSYLLAEVIIYIHVCNCYSGKLQVCNIVSI